MRHRFVRDKRSKLILDDLAQYRGGNRSRVVREALVALAGMQARLDKIEKDPAFQEMMRRSDADIRAGRGITASALRASSWESSSSSTNGEPVCVNIPRLVPRESNR